MEPTDQNRRAWDEVHRSYQRQGRHSAGELGIPDEVFELFPEVQGKHVLQLETGSGAATAELAAVGALVTTVDPSGEGEEELKRRLRLLRLGPLGETVPDVAYVHAQIEDLPIELQRNRFDLVFTGGDLLARLADLDKWAHGVAAALKPGGMLIAYDSHPVTTCVDPLGHWREDYFDGRPRLGQVVDAMSNAGLHMTKLVEFQTLYNWLQRDRRVPWDLALLAEKTE
jgi:SAM-dependent methyltransferase